MTDARKLAAILVVDIVGFSRLTARDEDRTLARVRALRGDLVDPTIAAYHGRVVKGTGDGVLAEFRSAVDAVRSALELQTEMKERNLSLPAERRIDLRIGIHIGDVVEETDGDLMGDGVNIAARLEALAEPGGLCLSAAVYEQVRDKLTIDAVDLGSKQLKNISRPIQIYSIQPGRETSDLRVAAQADHHLALPDRPSIAVLPFQEMSADDEQGYFTDGVVEDLITGLSRIRWLFVIARNSSFTYKGRAVDVRQVGRELGVRYVLEGSVRKAGKRLRVTAQLVEAESGAHLWADKYDGAVEDVFDFQDAITERVVGIAEPNVRKSEIERARRKRPDNLGAYDLFLRAMPYLQARMPEEARVAIPLLEQALALDPDYFAAHAHLAWCHEWCFTRGGYVEAERAAALHHARITLASDTDDASALAVAGWVVIVLTKERKMAIDAIDRALAINPSCATAHYFAALTCSFDGRSQAAIEHANRALRLSPFDPSAFEAHLALGVAAIAEGEFEEAAEQFATAARINPRHSLFPFCEAVALALAGRPNDASSLVERGLELEPSFRIQIFSVFGMAPPVAEKFIAGARLLGLPE